MTGQEDKRPNELIEHAPVTLRRYRAEDVDALFGAVTESQARLHRGGAPPAGSAPGVRHGHRCGVAPEGQHEGQP